VGEYQDKVKGEIKKDVGELTNDEKMKREGEVDKAKGKLKEVGNDIKDKVERAT
jgi:uncharacterized protein YjbJ (UPF0337 family)